ncbi:unnamed protein product [Linum tenue]|uniref:Phytocyanin domain-containing protein n=1 Tax=Linum tenue TaxID=586396 RepID=A0AAV0HLN3_9ROSI|nr:unnamed protein product [Linum tenue]
MGFEAVVSTMIMTASFLLGVTEAFQFPVGGKQGWVVEPKERYGHWAERLRFQVNDTLYFKYEKGRDSVLVVKKGEYDNCNASAPVQAFTEGNSLFRLDRSGPFFFISGFADHCAKGQKLVVVVLSEHHKKPTPSPPAAPTPSPSSVVTPPPPPAAAALPPTDAVTPPAAAPTPVANINSGAGVALRFTVGASLAGLLGLAVIFF